jgi:YggT family protein
MNTGLSLLAAAIQIYSLIVVARMIMSWFPVTPGSAWEPVYGFVFAVTEPPLAAIRSVVPPVRMGAGALDLAPLLLLLALWLLAGVLAR